MTSEIPARPNAIVVTMVQKIPLGGIHRGTKLAVLARNSTCSIANEMLHKPNSIILLLG